VGVLAYVLASADPVGARLPAYGARQTVLEFQNPSSFIGFTIAGHDFNCDGRGDILVLRGHSDVSTQTLPVAVLLNDRRGGFVEGTASVFAGSVPRITANRQVVVADFNGDGRPDVFLVDHGNDHPPFPGAQNKVLLSTSDCRYVDGTAGLPQQTDFTHSAASGDFDGDGDIDLYIGNFSDPDHPAQIWINDGTGRFAVGTGRLPPPSPMPFDYLSALAVDVDRDGAVDLVLGASQGVPNAVLRNDGTGHFSFLAGAMPPKPFGETDPKLVYDVQTLDLDGDGFPDLLLAYTSANPADRRRWIQALVNNGDGTFRDETAARLPPQSRAERAAPYDIVVVDADGDGALDILVRVAGPLVDAEPPPFYRNTGGGVFAEAALVTTEQLWGRWVLLDVDGDGGRDFFTSCCGNLTEFHAVLRQAGPPLRPGTPLGVAATRGAFPDRVRVWWPPVWGAARYEIWRATSPRGIASRRATVTTFEYDDLQAGSGATYYYQVRALNGAGTSARSTRVAGFAGGPDLLVAALASPPATLPAGQTFPITETTRNAGNAGAGASTTRYYLSRNAVKGPDDRRLGATRRIAGLAAGAESSAPVTLRVPADLAPASYLLLACADDTGVVAERAEDNNCRASAGRVAVTARDLVVTALADPPATALLGGPLKVRDTTGNQGLSRAGPSGTRYYLSADPVRGDDIRLEGERSVPALDPGEDSAGGQTVFIPRTAAAGVYRLLACADDRKGLAETDETNNCRASARAVTVEPAPDLAVTAVTPGAASVSAGGSLDVSAATTNAGTGPAGASRTRFFLSLDGIRNAGDQRLAPDHVVDELAIGAAATATVTVTVPPAVAAGHYVVIACADAGGAVTESREDNNCRASPATVTIAP
jgi:hypothetical protein